MKTVKNTEQTWNLGLLYVDEKDPQIEADLLSIEKTFAAFEKKYKDKDFTETPEKLLNALKDLEKLDEIVDHKPWWYFALRMYMDSSDTVAQSTATKYEERLTKAGNRIKFFSLAVGKIPKVLQKKFLKSPLLAPYRYMLERIFIEAEHMLSEKEEQLASLLSQTSYSMWVDALQKIETGKTIEWKGEKIPLSKAQYLVPELPRQERLELHGKVNDVFKSISEIAEAEINAIFNYKKTMDELRGYKKPYSATVQSYENDEETVENLVSLVTQRFDISKKFYKLHAKLLREEKLSYADRATKIGDIKHTFTFDESVAVVRDVFTKLDPEFSHILDSFVANGQTDVYPRKGKTGGAFCWGIGLLPTYVLLNHTDDLNSVETLAHEMGHAIHTEFSKNQPAHYRGYTMSVAEVASTFFEQAVAAELESRLPPEEKIILLHNRIRGDIQTIFRQIACFNFEKELHEKIRESGQVPGSEIAHIMSRHMQAYLGPVFDLTVDDGYGFVGWSHIRNFFYVYSYAYGQLISRALYENWKKDPSYIKKVKEFLSAGSSKSPKDIFKSIGIDTSHSEFFEQGLQSIEKDIAELEKLAKKTGLIKG